MKADLVVLDTNVLVSLILGKRLHELVIWHKDLGITIFICPELIDELTSVLKRPKFKKLLTSPVEDYVQFIQSVSNSVIIEQRFDRAPDVKDNYLFDLAYTVKSHYIVTHDFPLLSMKQVNKIKIVLLKDWLALIKAR